MQTGFNSARMHLPLSAILTKQLWARNALSWSLNSIKSCVSVALNSSTRAPISPFSSDLAGFPEFSTEQLLLRITQCRKKDSNKLARIQHTRTHWDLEMRLLFSCKCWVLADSADGTERNGTGAAFRDTSGNKSASCLLLLLPSKARALQALLYTSE